MTVEQLIAFLQTCPPKATVLMPDGERVVDAILSGSCAAGVVTVTIVDGEE